MNLFQYILIYLITALFVIPMTGQNCMLSFDGDAELCYGVSNTYLSTIPNSINSVEWELDGQTVSDQEDLFIDWEIYGSGTFNLCLTTTDSCNNALVDPFCQMIIVEPLIEEEEIITLCNGNFIEVLNQETQRRDTSFSVAGTHFYTFVAANGCDSIVTYQLTIMPSERIMLPDSSICAEDFYELGDSMYTTSGRKQQFIADSEGCFQSFILQLEVRDPIETFITEQLCIEDLPFAIWDTTVIETSIFDRRFTAADGCDSTVIVDLMIFPMIDTLLFDTLCAEGIFPIGDTVFNTTGTHVYTFEEGSFVGCDSIVTIDLIVEDIIESFPEIILCQGEALPIDQSIVTLDFIPDTDIVGDENVRGIATAINGCDSTINYAITVNPTSFTEIDTTLCFDSSIMIGGNVFFSSTTGAITLRNQFDCDSIVEYVVRSTATRPIEFEFEQTLCPETDDLFVGDSLITETGIHRIILPSATGCDSLVIADITVFTEEDLTHIYEDVLCTGLVYEEIDGITLTEGGTYVFDHLESASTGCDSIIILTLIEDEGEQIARNEIQDICEGDFFVHPDFPRDTLRTESVHPLSTIFPETCENFDLVVTIVFKDSIHVSTSEILCEGDSIVVGNSVYKEEGMFIDTLRRSGPVGCDSIVTTTIELRDCNIEIEEDIMPSECNGESTGSIEFEVTVGMPPLFYELSLPDSGIVATGRVDNLFEPIIFDSLAIGTYTLVLEDTVNAFKEFFLNVDQPNAFTVDWIPSEINSFHLACEGDDNGTLELLPNGGTPPYEYIWSNGETSDQLINLTAGTYTVTVTDNMDCVYIESFEMIEPDSLVPNITVGLPNCSDLSAGEIVVRSIDGGVAPFSYKMGVAPFSTERRYEELSAGEYTVITKDDNGCTYEFVADLPEPEIPELLFEPDVFIDLGEVVTVDLQATVPLVRAEWDGPDGLSCYDCEDPSIQPTDSKIFMVSVISVDSCVTSKELTIHVNKQRDVFVPNIFSPNGDGLNDRLVIFGGPEVLSILDFQVFDRWGSRIFSATGLAPNVEEGAWDGTFRDRRLRAGSYVWKARIAFIDGEVLEYFGDVVIK